MFCPKCGEPSKNTTGACGKCGYTMPAPTVGLDGMAGILPTNTSGWAIAAGYLGLFSLILVPAPVALGVGIVALRKLKANPGQRGLVRAWIGIVMGALGTVVLVVVTVGAAVSRR